MSKSLKTLNIGIGILLMLLTNSMAASQTDSTLNAAILGPRTEKIDKTFYDNIYYVSDISGSDNTGDGTKDNPWKSISNALKNIKTTTTKKALFIGQGNYKNGTLALSEFVDLFGGFSPAWERDVLKNKTILDGENIRPVVLAADNCRLDGFVVRNGLSRYHGAGMLCDDTSPHISNNIFENNVVLEPEGFNHSRIHQEGHHGGAIACLYNATPVIENNIFYQNKTSIGTGAGIAFYGWVRKKGAPETEMVNNSMTGGLQAIVKNNVFISNVSGINDIHRTRSSSGAAISCAFEARPVIQNNLIAMNQAKGRSDAGGIYSEYFSYPSINGNWILANIADDDGGGFYTMKLGQPLLINNFIAGNWTTGGGVGGVRLSKEGRALIKNNTVIYNPGGGLMCVDSYMELDDNTIMLNPKGAGLKYVMSFSYFKPSLVTRNTFGGNEEGDIVIVEDVGDNLIRKDNKTKSDFKSSSAWIYLDGKISSIKFDASSYSSSLYTDPDLSLPHEILGKVIKIGEKWSIIKNVNDKNIVVWGDVSNTLNTDSTLDFKVFNNGLK